MIHSTHGDERNRQRRLFLARRDSIPPEELVNWSGQILRTLMSLPGVWTKQCFFIYCHFRSEVRTEALIATLLEQGKTVCVPVSQPELSQMVAVVITDPKDLAPGYMGIPEPLPAAVRERMVAPSTIEVAIIPGAVFDRSGHRLGYGKGFYDRFLAQAPQALRVGLAFSCQIVDRIPASLHDEPLDMVVSEEGLLTWPQRKHASDRSL